MSNGQGGIPPGTPHSDDQSIAAQGQRAQTGATKVGKNNARFKFDPNDKKSHVATYFVTNKKSFIAKRLQRVRDYKF